MEGVIDAFGQVIGSKARRTTSELIRGLSAVQGDHNKSSAITRYTDHAFNLPPLTCNLDHDNVNGTITIGGVTENIRYHGGGSYGQIYLGNSGSVYKKVRLDERRLDPANLSSSIEDFHRELFIEPFIQTVLQLDAGFGTNVANIQYVYRDSTVVRSGESRSAAASQQRPRTYVYYYKMEPIRYTLRDYFPTLSRDAAIGAFINLGSILSHFERRYGFYHRDLHAGNIMFTVDGRLKLIDFGMSCMTLGDIQYSKSTEDPLSLI